MQPVRTAETGRGEDAMSDVLQSKRPTGNVDRAEVAEFADRALAALIGGATAQLVYLGDRLGIYRALAAGGPATAAELAARTGLARRYLAEWLAQQAAVRFVAFDPDTGRFALPAGQAAVLATDDSPTALAGAFEAMAGWSLGIDDLADAFRSGEGIGWDAHDERVLRGVARFFGAAYRAHLVDEWVPALDLSAALRQGARVADVGCGQGLTTVLLAEAFPNSRFVGVDASASSIEHAQRRAAAAGVTGRVQFKVADADGLDGGPYDVVCFVDCLHDFGDPVAAAARARQQLADQGTVVLVEPFARDELADNLTDNPGAGLHYAASTFLCVPHSLSEPGQAALGAQAGGRTLAETLAAAGLSRTERVATTAIHAVYAAHP
jgi:SAM-dependent methyltransferase